MTCNFSCLDLLVKAIVKSAQIKEFMVTTDLILESLFKLLFGFFQLFVILEEIKMGQGP